MARVIYCARPPTSGKKQKSVKARAVVAVFDDPMSELIFEVRDAEDGGFNAKALGKAIITQDDSWDELKANLLEAVESSHKDS